jgi:acetyltransferase
MNAACTAVPARHARRSRLTQIDYDREMAFIASRKRADGSFETLGVARAVADPDNIASEFAIIVRSDLKGMGLGHILLTKLVDYCRARGTKKLVGETLSYNHGLLALIRPFGFRATCPPGSDTTLLELDLN